MRVPTVLLLCTAVGCASTIDGLHGDSGVPGVDRPISAVDVPSAMDVANLDAGPSCSSLPNAPVATTGGTSFGVGAATLLFDSTGNLLVGRDNGVVDEITPDGSHTMVAELSSEIMGMALSSTGEILLAIAGYVADGGDQPGQIVGVDLATHSRRVLVASFEGPGGVAVDAFGYLWFTDNVAGTINRISLSATFPMAEVVSRDVPAPNGLAFDAAGTNLYVTSFPGTIPSSVYQITLTWGDGGVPVTALPATQYFDGLTPGGAALLGIALDACGNVYVSCTAASQIWRVPPPPSSASVQIVTDVTCPESLTFGRGGPFNNHTLYTLDAMGTLQGANVGAQGVPLPPL